MRPFGISRNEKFKNQIIEQIKKIKFSLWKWTFFDHWASLERKKLEIKLNIIKNMIQSVEMDLLRPLGISRKEKVRNGIIKQIKKYNSVCGNSFLSTFETTGMSRKECQK